MSYSKPELYVDNRLAEGYIKNSEKLGKEVSSKAKEKAEKSMSMPTSGVNMSGTSMGSYNKPMMKGSGLNMKCGSQVGKHMAGPKMMGGDEKKGFRESFAENRKAGKKEFEYEGKMYNTKTAEDVAKTLSDKDLFKKFEEFDAISSSYSNIPGSSKTKSNIERFRSYNNEGLRREELKNK